MKIIKIKPQLNGAHQNQASTANIMPPKGWAIIPDEIQIPETFPFVDIEVEDGVVTSMTAGVVPEPEPEVYEPTEIDDINALLVDHEYRLTLIELGVI